MFQSITLLKLEADFATDALRQSAAAALRAACVRGGYDATVGLPADASALKSWDLALVAVFRTREQASAFDAPSFVAGACSLPEGAIAVTKGWRFDVVA
jgi:hypothetical protein